MRSWWLAVGLAVVAGAGWCDAREPHRPHRPRPPRAPKPPRQPPSPPEPANVHFAPDGTVALPGRGLTLSWSPAGDRIAVGGRFREKATGLRYDTRIADVGARTLVQSFACHYFFVVSTAWTANPFLGEVLADGGGDHAVKLWDPTAPGSRTCDPGQFRAADGAVESLGQVNGWTTALAFSPDGRFLAGASRDRMIRVWRMAPGPHQFAVVAVLYDATAGNFASVDWTADGRGLVTGDRRGKVVAWDFDPAIHAWDDATIAEFAALPYKAQPEWCGDHPELVRRPVRWSDQRKGWMWNVRVSPDGATVAAGGEDRVVVVYDTASGAVRYRAASASKTDFHGLGWRPDGSLLAAGGEDGSIYLFDAATGLVHDRLEGSGDVVGAVAWSPDGSRLATTAGGARVSLALLESTTGPDQTIRFWRAR